MNVLQSKVKTKICKAGLWPQIFRYTRNWTYRGVFETLVDKSYGMIPYQPPNSQLIGLWAYLEISDHPKSENRQSDHQK